MKNKSFVLIVICVMILSTVGAQEAPIDGLVAKQTMSEKRLLPYVPLREADIMWSKKVTRVIDTREKINLSFRYPEMPLFTVLEEGIETGELTAYSGENDQFKELLDLEQLKSIMYKSDTVEVYNHDTGNMDMVVVTDELNPEDIMRYRVKEVWYFDKNEAQMKVRILGIAPMLEVRDELGNFKYELPLFWVYYPHAREYLSGQAVFLTGNDEEVLSWEDWLEMRRFSSYITKESNVHDRKLEAYVSGVDLLMTGQKIHTEIFNKEQDMWAY